MHAADLIPTRPIEREERELDEIVVRVTRTAKVVSGGKRMSFTALAVVGDRNGHVGWGYGKAGEVPFAVEKAIRKGRKEAIRVPLSENHTIPHAVEAKYGATRVILRPASRGTGLKAGAAVRAVLEFAGVKDALTKTFGSTNPLNAVKATFLALRKLRSKEQVEALRGVRITGPKAVPWEPAGEKEKGEAPGRKPEAPDEEKEKPEVPEEPSGKTTGSGEKEG